MTLFSIGIQCYAQMKEPGFDRFHSECSGIVSKPTSTKPFNSWPFWCFSLTKPLLKKKLNDSVNLPSAVSFQSTAPFFRSFSSSVLGLAPLSSKLVERKPPITHFQAKTGGQCRNSFPERTGTVWIILSDSVSCLTGGETVSLWTIIERGLDFLPHGKLFNIT